MTVTCPKCGHQNNWPVRFCGQCGAWIAGVKPGAPTPVEAGPGGPVAEGAHAEGGTHRNPIFYFWVFVWLGIITVVEIAAAGLDVDWFKFTALGVLAAIKFALVAMFFMHLKGDRRLYGFVFLWPLAIAMALILALALLFGLYRS